MFRFIRTPDVRLSLMAVLGVLIGLAASLSISEPVRAQQTPSNEQGSLKIDPRLDRLIDDLAPRPVKAWVFFTNKGFDDPADEARAIRRVAEQYNEHARERRRLRTSNDTLFDATDLPVAKRYIDAVRSIGVEVHVQSRWLNAISVTGSRQQMHQIAELDFVRRLQPVNRSTGIDATISDSMNMSDGGFYGNSEGQLNQINVIALHDHGFTGKGIIVGILDTGFRTSHEVFNNPDKPLNIVAAWDFINDDPNVGQESGDDPDQHTHGTLILGTLAAYKPNTLVGGAFDASFILAKTEDITNEYQQEEDFYVAGLEFIEMNGGDVATSSLGYIDWYTQDDLDGQTAVTTVAVNDATSKGMLCCTAAGNEGHDRNSNTSHLIAPSDALQVFTAGAVESTGEIAGFSSDGPTADGRVKPEVLAQGVSTETISPWDDHKYASASGTSLSTPLVAGAVACLAQARRAWTVDEMRNHVLESGDWYKLNGTYDADYVYGYGILNAIDAVDALLLDPISPGTAGMPNTLSASGATAGERVHFVWGTQEGTADIPGCPGATVYIHRPKIAGSAVADANGNVSLQRFVPGKGHGLTVHLQSLEIASCRISNVVVQTIQ